MFQLGKKITSANDPLTSISFEDLIELIEKPNDEIVSMIHQLRMVLSIDVNKYRKLKTSLPYITCGNFSPSYRRTENFGSIEYFMLDLDHLHLLNLSPASLKKQICKDSRIFMAFTSPGNDGLKVLFKLKEKLYDAGKYSMFYKLFAHKFSEQYQLPQIVDDRTSDVTRACFVSHDTEIYVNEAADEVDISTIMDFDSYLDMKILAAELKEIEASMPKVQAQSDKPLLNDDILLEIKRKLNPNIRLKPDKIIFVPEKLNENMALVKEQLLKFEMEVKQITDIHYGKKLNIMAKNYWAEINIFYGKNGYSVVKTPKRGSNIDLANLAHQVICELLIEQHDS